MPRRIPLSLLSVILGLIARVACPQADSASPKFSGTLIPDPPCQAEAWVPPDTSLPEALVSSTALLFQAGLADPRGCEYREIEVAVGSVWTGDDGVVATHGWVLPLPSKSASFAVAWNGLVYPVASIGKPTSIRRDIETMLQADAARTPGPGGYRFRDAWAEADSISHETCLPLKVCLLLRLGEVELSQRTWRAWTAGMRADTNDDAVHLNDPFSMLARDWLWALFDRGLCCHMRADDQLALLSFRALPPARTAVEAIARDRGLDVRFFRFLDPAEELLADQERRATQREPQDAPFDRVNLLIRDLDNTSVRQRGQPGGIDLSEAGVVVALVVEGDAAVDALIDTIEKDTRLTRSVQFGRDFHHGRQVLPVSQVAHYALTAILGQSSFPATSKAKDKAPRVAFAVRARAFWEQYRALNPPERWFRMLADDNATPSQWLHASERIVEPTNVTVVAGSRFRGYRVKVRRLEPGEPLRPKGHVLRERRHPSVADLMARRVNAISTVDLLHEATGVAICLSEWDPHTHADILRDQLSRCLVALSSVTNASHSHVELPSQLATLVINLHDARDEQALRLFAAGVRRVSPSVVVDSGLFAPIWTFADEPVACEGAAALFSDPASPWCKWPGFQVALDRRLLVFPQFRSIAVRWLKCTEVDQLSGGLRRCDLVAVRLAEDGRDFDLRWPEAQRNEAVRRLMAKLEGTSKR